MARPVRLEYAGALYQVTAREDRQEPFLGDAVFIDRIHGADSGDTLREVSKARRRSPLTPDLSHCMKRIEQSEPFWGKVFEKRRQVFEIKTLDRILRTPAGIELMGDLPRFGKEFLIRLYSHFF